MYGVYILVCMVHIMYNSALKHIEDLLLDKVFQNWPNQGSYSYVIELSPFFEMVHCKDKSLGSF